jgi:hypothetical protein
MTDVSNNGMFEPEEVGKLLDLDGATVDDAGPEDPAEPADRDTDGTPVGRADYEADTAPR